MDSDTFNITKVKDGFFLGDEMTATNYEVLINFKISHMINAAGPQIRNAWENLNIKYLTLNWNESPTQHLFDPKDEIANRIVSFIDDSYKSGEGFLVHSVRGQNRACLVVLIYFIRKFRWSLRKALEFLTSKKSDIDIPSYFSNQISSFETRLAKSGVGPKSNSWHDVGTGIISDIDNEEVVIRNTYLNGVVIVNNMFSLNNEFKNPYGSSYYGRDNTKVCWTDQVVDLKEDEMDLYLLHPKQIKPITTHKFKKPLKSCLKGGSKVSGNENLSSNNLKENNTSNNNVLNRPSTGGPDRRKEYLNNNSNIIEINRSITKDDSYMSNLNNLNNLNSKYNNIGIGNINTNNNEVTRSSSYIKNNNSNSNTTNNNYVSYNKLNYDFANQFDLTKGLSQGFKPTLNNNTSNSNNLGNTYNNERLTNNINNYINNNISIINNSKSNNTSNNNIINNENNINTNNVPNTNNNYMTFGSNNNKNLVNDINKKNDIEDSYNNYNNLSKTTNPSNNNSINNINKPTSSNYYGREKSNNSTNNSNNNLSKHHNHNFLREDSTKKNRNNNLSHSMKINKSNNINNSSSVIKNDYFNNNNNVRPVVNKDNVNNNSSNPYSNYINKNNNNSISKQNIGSKDNYSVDLARKGTPQTNSNSNNILNDKNNNNSFYRPGTADNNNNNLNKEYDKYGIKIGGTSSNNKIVVSPQVQDFLNKPIKKINNTNSGVSTSDYSFNNNLNKNEKESNNTNNISSNKLEKNNENQRILNNNYFNNNNSKNINDLSLGLGGNRSFKLNSQNNILNLNNPNININDRPNSGGLKKGNSKPSGKVCLFINIILYL